MKITNQYGPNTTILMPGGCNAKCDFCFWDRKMTKVKVPPDYLLKVTAALRDLPEQFQTVSVSGGEPTISPYFTQMLTTLARFRRSNPRYDRFVLTTNGTHLLEHLPLVGVVFDHINISRHAITDDENAKVFGAKCLGRVDLKNLIRKIHLTTECDVTLRCVITKGTTSDWCQDFIAYAKGLGADAVSFRKEASNVKPTKAEKDFVEKYGEGFQTKCPVCRGRNQRVDGFDVRWKGSVAEPSIETKGVYEAVIHPNGETYTDWGAKVPFPFEDRDLEPQKRGSKPLNAEDFLAETSRKLVTAMKIDDKLEAGKPLSKKEREELSRLRTAAATSGGSHRTLGGCGGSQGNWGGCGTAGYGSSGCGRGSHGGGGC